MYIMVFYSCEVKALFINEQVKINLLCPSFKFLPIRVLQTEDREAMLYAGVPVPLDSEVK